MHAQTPSNFTGPHCAPLNPTRPHAAIGMSARNDDFLSIYLGSNACPNAPHCAPLNPTPPRSTLLGPTWPHAAGFGPHSAPLASIGMSARLLLECMPEMTTFENLIRLQCMPKPPPAPLLCHLCKHVCTPHPSASKLQSPRKTCHKLSHNG